MLCTKHINAHRVAKNMSAGQACVKAFFFGLPSKMFVFEFWRVKPKPVLKAFTITETVVAMVISGLMITMAAFSWGAFEKQFHSFQNGNEQIQQIEQLHSVLILDIERCLWMKRKANGIELEMKDGSKVGFTFGESISRITNMKTENFDLKTEEWNVAYNKSESVSIDNYVNKLNLLISQNKYSIPFNFFKQYDALQKLKMNKEK